MCRVSIDFYIFQLTKQKSAYDFERVLPCNNGSYFSHIGVVSSSPSSRSGLWVLNMSTEEPIGKTSPSCSPGFLQHCQKYNLGNLKKLANRVGLLKFTEHTINYHAIQQKMGYVYFYS